VIQYRGMVSRWLATLVFAALCLVMVGAMAALSLRRVGQELAMLVADDARDLYVVQKLQSDSEHTARKARTYLFTGEERFLREMEASRTAVQEDLRQAHQVIDSPQGTQLLRTIEQHQHTAWVEMDRAIEQRRLGNIDESIRRVLQAVQPERDALDAAFAMLVEHKHTRLELHQAGVVRGAHRSFLLVLGSLVLVLLLTGALMLYRRRVARREERVASELRESQAKLRTMFEELRRAHARILDILEDSGVAFYAVDKQWRITYVNKAAEPLLRQQRERMLGQKLWEVFPEAVDTVYWNQFHRALEENVPVHFEAWYEPLELWTEVRAQPCVDGLSVYFLDITARKQAEEEARENAEKYRALASASFDGIVIHDAGLVLEANESHSRMFGYTAEEVVGTPVSRFIAPEDRERVERIIQTRQTSPYEVQGLRKDGSRFHVEVIARYLEYHGKRVRAAAMRDITERKWMSDYEQKLLGIVGHDLRSPLSAVLASAELLQLRGDLSAPQEKAVARIRRAAVRMRGLITTMLDYTRERSGVGVPIAPAPVCFHEVGARVLEELRTAHADHRFVCDAEGDTCGRWDPVRLEQVAMNLLENAVKYSPPGSLVRAVYRGEADRVVFSVHNEGRPIPPELLAHLFEPFRRGEQTERTVRQSAGLGLFIVKSLVSAHGGEVDVCSTEAGGTTFTVVLPRDPPGREREAPAVHGP